MQQSEGMVSHHSEFNVIAMYLRTSIQNCANDVVMHHREERDSSGRTEGYPPKIFNWHLGAEPVMFQQLAQLKPFQTKNSDQWMDDGWVHWTLFVRFRCICLGFCPGGRIRRSCSPSAGLRDPLEYAGVKVAKFHQAEAC